MAHVEEDFEYQYVFTTDLRKEEGPTILTTALLQWEFGSSTWDDYGLTAVFLSCKAPTTRRSFTLRARVLLELSQNANTFDVVTIKERCVVVKPDRKNFIFPISDVYKPKLQDSQVHCKVKISVLPNLENETNLWPLVSVSINFMAEHSLANATIVIGEKRFFVNIDLLSSRSRYFEKIRRDRMGEAHTIVPISNIEAGTMRKVLRYFYFYDLDIEMPKIEKMLQAAYFLEIDVLMRVCEEMLVKEEMNSKVKFSWLLHIAYAYNLTLLKDKCLQVVAIKSAVDYPWVELFDGTDSLLKQHTSCSTPICVSDTAITTVSSFTNVIKFNVTSKRIGKLLEISISPICATELLITTNWFVELDMTVKFKDETKVFNNFTFDYEHKTLETSFDVSESYSFIGIVPQRVLEVLPVAIRPEVKFTVDTIICGIYGLRYYMTPLHDFSKKTPVCNLVIRCKESEFFVNCNMLGHFSEYFEALSSKLHELARDAQSSLPCLKLEDSCDLASISRLLHMLWSDGELHPRYMYPTFNELITLLKLSQGFLLSEVVVYCVQELENQRCFRLDVIQMAHDFNLEPLLEWQLSLINTSTELTQEIQRYGKPLSEEVYVLLMKKLVELPE